MTSACQAFATSIPVFGNVDITLASQAWGALMGSWNVKDSMGAKPQSRGWEFGDLVWEITPSGKFIFFSKKVASERYQLNLGGASEILDVHKTVQKPDGTKTYETVFAMRKE